MKIKKLSIKEYFQLVVLIAATIAALGPVRNWMKENVIIIVEDVHILRHVSQSNADVAMALMDKIDGNWYVVNGGGAATDVLMFQTAEMETFVFIPDERVFWVTYKVEYDEVREQWYYHEFDEHGTRNTIYKR